MARGCVLVTVEMSFGHFAAEAELVPVQVWPETPGTFADKGGKQTSALPAPDLSK